MTPRMIYLVGQPGSGKSTLMARLTDDLNFLLVEQPVAHLALHDRVTGEVIGAEIGRRRGLFAGTDALASSIIERAIPWVQTVPYPLLLAEGARLANRRFIVAAAAAGYHVTLALLDHAQADAWRKARARQIGHEQSAAWVKGRLSASRNLVDFFAGSEKVTVLRGHPEALYPTLAELISADVSA